MTFLQYITHHQYSFFDIVVLGAAQYSAIGKNWWKAGCIFFGGNIASIILERLAS